MSGVNVDSTEFEERFVKDETADNDRSKGQFRFKGKSSVSPLALIVALSVVGIGGAWATGLLDGDNKEEVSLIDKDNESEANEGYAEDPLGGVVANPDEDIGTVLADEEVPGLSDNKPGANGANGNTDRDRRIAEAKARAEERKRAHENRVTSPVMVLNGGGGGLLGDSLRNQSAADTGAVISQATNSNARASSGVAAGITPTSIRTLKAGNLGDRNLLITAGTLIPCTLQTAIDSTQLGLVSCIINSNVLSANGNVVLIDKGTRVLGQYAAGIQQGQSRLFVSWNRAVTPKGVSINLESPAADSLGRSGFDGKTKSFFFKRFGASLLLSIVGDIGNAAGGAVTNANETINVPNRAADIALENSVNIQPILRATHGKEVSIFVSNDLDFSDVYELNLKP